MIGMVVVVDDRPSLLVVLAVVALVLLTVGVLLFFLIGRASGSVLVVAIPGFPIESIILGIVVGAFLLALKRKSRRPD